MNIYPDWVGTYYTDIYPDWIDLEDTYNKYVFDIMEILGGEMTNYSSHWKQQYLKTDSFLHEIARGNVRESYPFSAYGRVTTLGAESGVLVRSQDGTSLDVPDSIQMSIVSTSAEDSENGTGIQSVVIEYLNSTLEYSYEVLILDGLTPVNTIATDIRWVQAVHMATFGSNTRAVGTVTVENSGIVYAQINPQGRTTVSSFRRVPKDKTFYIMTMYGGASSGTAAAKTDLNLVTTEMNGIDNQESGIVYPQLGISLQDATTTLTLPLPYAVTEGHIVGFLTGTDKAASVVAGYLGWIE